MKHIQILFLVINLIIGALVIIYAYTLNRKYHNQVLRYLVLYMLSFNLFIFIDFNYKYTLYNIFGSSFSSFPVILATSFYLMISLAELGMIYFLYLTVVSLKNSVKSRFVIRFFIILILLYAACSIIGATAYFLKSIEKWIYIVHMIWILSMMTIIFSILIELYFYSRQVIDRHRISQLSSFALIISAGYLPFLFSNLDYYFLKINLDNLDPLIFAIINICPFIWLKFFYIKYQPDTGADSAGSEVLARVIKDFNISDRESEIIQLIIEGRSNKEIEDFLNISLNTVKNHIYNTYRKLGVNSRSQLIRLISSYRGNQAE